MQNEASMHKLLSDVNFSIDTFKLYKKVKRFEPKQ